MRLALCLRDGQGCGAKPGHHTGLVEIFPKPAQVTRSFSALSEDPRKVGETFKNVWIQKDRARER